MVKDLKLSKGLKCILWSEIFSIIAVICLYTLDIEAITSKTAQDVLTIISFAFFALMFVWLIMGLVKIKHANGNFAFAFWWFFVSLILFVALVVLIAIDSTNKTIITVCNCLQVAISLSDFVIVISVLSGITQYFKNSKSQEGFVSFVNTILCIYLICVLLLPNTLALIGSFTTISVLWQWIFFGVEVALTVFGYISYIAILQKASEKV